MASEKKNEKFWIEKCSSLLPETIEAIQIYEVGVPAAVRAGENVLLACHYDMQGDVLYSIKWYKGRREFYRYTLKENPAKKVFKVAGMNVDVSPEFDRPCSSSRRGYNSSPSSWFTFAAGEIQRQPCPTHVGGGGQFGEIRLWSVSRCTLFSYADHVQGDDGRWWVTRAFYGAFICVTKTTRRLHFNWTKECGTL